MIFRGILFNPLLFDTPSLERVTKYFARITLDMPESIMKISREMHIARAISASPVG